MAVPTYTPGTQSYWFRTAGRIFAHIPALLARFEVTVDRALCLAEDPTAGYPYYIDWHLIV